MTYIRVVQHAPQNFSWWRKQAEAGRLDLEPSFQRRSDLWSRFKRAHLIDSILNDFDIPKIYVADFTIARSELNEAKRPYAIVDGKQRFEAVFDFLGGEFPLNQSATFDADPSLVIRGLDFPSLKRAHPDLARKIEVYEPVVMSITTDDESKIFEMFVRLNSGEAANSAERRNAKPGPVPELVREIASHPFLTNRIRFSTKRMAEFNLAAKLMLMEHFGEFSDTKASNLDRFVAAAANETGATSYGEQTAAHVASMNRYVATKDRVFDVFEGLAEAFNSNDALLSSAGSIPVYYWIVRTFPETIPNLRDFLEGFTKKVITAMRNARDNTGAVDKRLLTYYTMGRSANDQQSIEGRYNILIKELKKKNLITA